MKRFLTTFIVIAMVFVFVGCDKEEQKDIETTSTITPSPTNTPSPTDTPEPTATPVEGINVALNKEIEVSSYTENTRRGWYPQCVNDGEIEAIDGVHMGWTSQVGKYVGGNFEETIEWVVIDLDKEYTIHFIKAWPRQDESSGGLYFPVDWQIDVSNDKETWTTVYEKQDDLGAEEYDIEPRLVELEDVKARYVRFMGTKLTDVNSSHPGDGLLMQLAELEIFSYD